MVRTRGSAARDNGGAGNGSVQEDALGPVPLAVEVAPPPVHDEDGNFNLLARPRGGNMLESDLSDSNNDTASSGYRVSGESVRSAASRPRTKKKKLGMRRRLSDGAELLPYRAPYASVARRLSLEAPLPASVRRLPSLFRESSEREELGPRPFQQVVQKMIVELGGGAILQMAEPQPSTSVAAALAVQLVTDPWPNDKVIANLRILEALHNAEITRTKMRQWCSVCEEKAEYSCCWNVSYCSLKCQQTGWDDGGHVSVCRRAVR